MSNHDIDAIKTAEAIVHDTFRYYETLELAKRTAVFGGGVVVAAMCVDVVDKGRQSAYDLGLPETNLDTIGLGAGFGITLTALGVAVVEGWLHRRKLAQY